MILEGVVDNEARQYVVDRTRGKARKYVNGWVRLEYNSKRAIMTTTTNGR